MLSPVRRAQERAGAARAWPLALGVVAGTVLGGAAALPWATWEPEPLMVLTGRAIQHLVPPWGYDTDRIRLQDLVVEMLCREPALELPLHVRRYRHLAACKVLPDDAKGASVEVQIPPDRRWNRSGAPVDAASVGAALEVLAPHQERVQPVPWHTVEVTGPLRLRVRAPPGVRGEVLLQDLAGVGVARPCADASQRGPEGVVRDLDCVEGTGPFHIVEPFAERAEGERVPNDALLTPALRPLARDELHLRRCEERLPLIESCQDLYFFALPTSGFLGDDGAPREEEIRAVARGLESRPPPWGWTARQPSDEAQPVTLVPDAENAVMRALEEARKTQESRSDRWVLSSRADLRVLWVVIRPSASLPEQPPTGCPSDTHRLSGEDRRAVRGALRGIASDPSFLQAVGGVAVLSPVPAVLRPPVRPAPAPSIPTLPGTAAGATGGLVLLTNTAWSDAADRLAAALPGLKVIKLGPSAEDRCRTGGAYDLSLLSVGASSARSVSSFLLGNLSAWYPLTADAPGGSDEAAGAPPDAADLATAPDGSRPNLLRYTRRTAAKEQRGEDVGSEVGALLAALDADVVPVAALRRSFAYHDGLRGWDAERQAFLPEELGLSDDQRPTGVPALLLFFGCSAVGVGYGLSRRVQERSAERTAAQVRGFHHELSRALTSAYAGLELLSEGVERRHVEEQLEEGMDLVDAVGLSVKDEAWSLELRGRSSWLAVLPGLVEETRARAEADGVRLDLALDAGPGAALYVPLPEQFLRRLALNLLENALKYREGAEAQIRVSIRRVGPWVALYVEDHGIGVRTSPERAFELGWRTPEATRQASGLGVGLAFVRAVAERAGGRAWLVSSHTPTLFEITLPVLDGDSKRHNGDRP